MKSFPNPEEALRQAGGIAERAMAPLEFLDVAAWLDREIPEPDRLLGDLLTTTSRVFLVGRTGLGKTLVALGIACGIASGRGFLHWHCHRAARVLIIDGEMPAELVKARAKEALDRIGAKIPPGNLVIFARDIEEEFSAQFPTLGKMEALNTPEGKTWLLALIEQIKPSVIIFDNVMSLISGDQKDELSWSATLDLVQTLTAKRIGQLWLDHTGHNQDRQYGSSTKAWRFDAVGIMAPLPEDQRTDHEVAFTLSFDHPGKARRRTPENWRDFDTVTVRLNAEGWSFEQANKSKRSTPKLSPMATEFYRALQDALAVTTTPGKTTRDGWYAECVRVGLTEPLHSSDTWQIKDAKRRKFRTYMAQLKSAGVIGINGEEVTLVGGEI